MTAPPARPNSALKLLVWTLNSSTASGETCTTWFEKPWLLVPYELLSTPSRMKLLSELRMPLTLNERVARVADRRLAHAGAEQREVGVGAAVERQVDDLLAADDLAAVARLGLEQAGRAGDLDRFADAADLQREVDALPGVDRDRDVLGDRGREALQLGVDAVGADADVQELIVALARR